ncbi:hypothetical protein Cgig2_005014 [Carnegiea gigantea]|uniref:Endonuclease/exonuclease/phosphatase domain-containing protein n=1 Tax=Carnegiea gigantea TaxID=171969 RepID=A0A9Q1L023_9CARY|nr:hypothetical protein Cgig2_005014 [Carnegiea gigantea]
MIHTVADLRGLLRSLVPKVVFLSDTKKSKSEMENILSKLGDFFGIFVDAKGRAGGLALLWNKLVTVDLPSCSLRHIDVSITVEGDAPIYRRMEGLDCYCANAERSLLFPNAFVSHIDFNISDHLPILLKCHSCIDKRSARKRQFMFENMWFTEPACEDVVTAAWSSTSHANAVDNLLSNLSKCSDELNSWNRTSFGNVSEQICDLEQRLKSQRDAPSRRQTLALIRDGRSMEEIL